MKRRMLLIAVGLVGLAARNAVSETLDFETSAYVADKTIVGVDTWAQSTDPALEYPDNYKVQAGPGGKWIHTLTTTGTTVYRSFPSMTGILDVRWKWRALSDSVHFCLGVSNGGASARLANRGLACMDPSGEIAAQGLGVGVTPSTETWTRGVWHYMRMVLDNSAGVNKFALYISEDSLRGVERLAMPATAMGGTGPLTRIVLRDEYGSGYVDIDDLSWEATAVWQAGAGGGGPGPDTDSLWSTARNWSTGAVPDSATHVIFTETFPKGCQVDKNAAVRSITLASAYKGNLNLGQQNLAVWGKGDFSGGNVLFTGTGHIRFPSLRGGSLIGPAAGGMLATVRHDGPGPLRLDARSLSVANLNQVQGTFDFNGFDLVVNGDFTVKNGQPGTLRNLDGRAVSVGHATHLEGSSKDTLLGLSSSPKGWTLAGSLTDSLVARFASLGNARATAGQGYAFQSIDAGANQGWIFVAAPAVAAQPKDTTVKVGEAAFFRVSASSKLPMTFQWLRDDKAIPNATDSVYTLFVTGKADSNAAFSCRLSNPAGNTNSAAARLKVTFPAPSVSPLPQAIDDTLSIRMIPSVPAARTFYSRNGSAYQEYQGPVILRDSTLVRAFSTFGNDTSGSASWNFPKPSVPRLAEPGIDPENMSFQDTLRVTLTPPQTGAAVYYTVDGSEPDSTKAKYLKSFVITTTTTVAAIAYLPGYLPSTVHTHIFIHKNASETIPPPTAIPGGGSFNDSIVVKLFPPTDVPGASVFYMTGNQGPFKFQDSLVLRASTTLKAIAISGSKVSDTATWEFKRRLEAPTASPGGRTFPDSIHIALNTKLDGAAIHFTWDGSEPTGASPTYDGHPLMLDSSAVLKAMAISGKDTSAVLSQNYTLIPNIPTASHRGGDYSSLITISLRSTSPRASIYYTLDGTTPGPENGKPAYSRPFNLDVSATLKAVAVAGQGAKLQRSSLLIENYSFISPGLRILGPGQRIDLSSNYNLVSPLAGASSVNVEVIAVDSLKAPKGFRDILFGIRLSLPEGAQAFPKVVLNSPTGDPRSLFAYQTTEQARYLTGNDTAEILAPGTYFLAIDTLAPVITYSGETFTDQDSTRLVVSIKDNVSNLLLDLDRSDSPSDGFRNREINGSPLLNVSLKNPPGSLLPLSLKLKVSDHSRASAFPADGSSYTLSQRISGPVRTPSSFHIGASKEDPWDLIALPLSLDPPLTLAQLRKNNAAPNLQGATLDPKTGDYRNLEAGESLPPGASIWLGATTSFPSLVFPSVQTVSRHGAGGYKITVHHGWNQVANPTLETLYWPVTREFPDVYQASLVKGLHAFDAATGLYAHAESLEPWRGYFAWYQGARDSTLDLLPDPVPAPIPSKAGKRGVGAWAGMSFGLNLQNGPHIRLGASSLAVNGQGLEDEPQPVGPGMDAARLFSARGGQRLETDMVHWTEGGLYTWTIVAGLPIDKSDKAEYGVIAGNAGNHGNAQDTSVGLPDRSARVEGLSLPQGYAAWAVSRKRGLRFALTEGAAIPMHPGFTDSLEVVAGPALEVEARLADIPTLVGAFGAGVEAFYGRFALRVNLPTASRLSLKVWSLQGRQLESTSLDLPEGSYRLVRDQDGRGYPTGMYVLSLEWIGGGKSGRLTRKIAIP